MGDKNEDKSADKDAKTIEKHMKKNGITQSHGLVVNENGDVVYDKGKDDRANPTAPPNTPAA